MSVVRNVLHVQVVVRLVGGCRGGGGAGPVPLLLSLCSLLVSLDVFVEMVGPGESLPALLAGEPLLPRVSPQMPLEFVRPGEGLVTEDPAAGERSLPRVPPEVSLEVGSLAVYLPTAGDVTDVLPLLVLVVGPGPVLTVGTLAPPAPPAGQALAVLQQGRGDLSVTALGWLGRLWVRRGGGPELWMVLVVGWGGARPLVTSSSSASSSSGLVEV